MDDIAWWFSINLIIITIICVLLIISFFIKMVEFVLMIWKNKEDCVEGEQKEDSTKIPHSTLCEKRISGYLKDREEGKVNEEEKCNRHRKEKRTVPNKLDSAKAPVSDKQYVSVRSPTERDDSSKLPGTDTLQSLEVQDFSDAVLIHPDTSQKLTQTTPNAQKTTTNK